ncbi:MAG: erv26 super protein [Piccolia ochrophora]|nr:MAG: erv26 super protein [Piccolia ochrophora]
MWILPLLGQLGLILGFLFLTLSIGLYYLSELVEEHSVLSKRILTNLIYVVVGIQLILALIDGLPWRWTTLSVGSHLVYKLNLRRFPFVRLSDPVFVTSCVLVALNHWAWFRYFSLPPSLPSPQSRYYTPIEELDIPSFTEVASYFGICVWLIPFALFVSLSAGDNVLPTVGSKYATGDAGRGKGESKEKTKGMAKALVDGVREWMGETGEVMGFWRGDRTRRF